MDKNTGIVAIACSIAEKVMTAKQVATASGFCCDYITEKLGFVEKRIALNFEKPSDYALNAANEVMNKASITADKIDFIIYCSNGIYDYQFWSPSAFIQQALGAKNSITFELNNGCNSSMGLFVAKNLLATHSDWRYGLVIVSDTLSKYVNYSDQASFPLFSFSDGAAAVLLQSNHNQNILLGHGLYTDGEYANCSRMEMGFVPPLNQNADIQNSRYIKMGEEKKIRHLREIMLSKNYIRVMKDALAKANVTENMLSYILTNQNSLSVFERVLNTLSIDISQHYLTNQFLGHIGGVDIFYGLNDILEKNLVSKNDLVLMATAGIGFHWGAHVLKV